MPRRRVLIRIVNAEETFGLDTFGDLTVDEATGGRLGGRQVIPRVRELLARESVADAA